MRLVRSFVICAYRLVDIFFSRIIIIRRPFEPSALHRRTIGRRLGTGLTCSGPRRQSESEVVSTAFFFFFLIVFIRTRHCGRRQTRRTYKSGGTLMTWIRLNHVYVGILVIYCGNIKIEIYVRQSYLGKKKYQIKTR